jgi:dephospho-CoA kinase
MNYFSLNLVVGITGLRAGGKDELSRILKEQGFNVRRVSDAVREECTKQGIIDPTTEQMQNIGDQGRINSGDNGFWAGRLLEILVREGNSCAAINGIRNPGEVFTLQRCLGDRFVLVGITAPIMMRYQRTLMRQEGHRDPKKLEDFLVIDDRDRGIGQSIEGQQVDRCLALVSPENLFFNSGSLEEYRQWIVTFLEKHRVIV